MLGFKDKWMKRFQDRLVDDARPHQSVEEFEEQFRNTLAVAIHAALRAENLNKGAEDLYDHSKILEWIAEPDPSVIIELDPGRTTTFCSSYKDVVKAWLRISGDYNKIRDERIQESWADIHEKDRTIALRFMTVLATGMAAIFIFLLASWLEIEIPLLKIR